MSRFKPAARTYVRPSAGWWHTNPYFVRYMIREGSAVLLTAYALVLLVGLYRLAQGEAAFEAWRAGLSSPLAIVLHLVAVAVVGYHSVTWFQVMPKTAPQLPVDPRLITGAGLAAAVGASVFVVGLLVWVMR
jgi:fumarate reductase subunit C